MTARKAQRPKGGRENLPESECRWSDEIFSNGEQCLHSVLGSSPIPAFVIGKDHRVIYWNRALSELSGIRAETRFRSGTRGNTANPT